MKKTIVIGGSGFIGTHLTKLLIGSGREVCVLGRKKTPPRALPADCSYFAGNYGDRKTLKKALMQSQIINESGYLEIIIGPMFSGKTSKLLEIYKQCKFCNIPVSVINYSEDKRYHNEMLSTHDKIMIPCIQSDNLRYFIDLLRIVKNCVRLPWTKPAYVFQTGFANAGLI